MPLEKFRVWIGVERENVHSTQPSGEYTDIDPGFNSEGVFDTQEDALELAERIHAFSAAVQQPHGELVGALAVVMRLFGVKSYEVSDELDNIRAETREQHTPTEGRRRR